MSFATDALAKVEAVLLSASDSADLSISVDGAQFSFESREALMDFRDRLREEAAEENRIDNERPLFKCRPLRVHGAY